jgi:ubiquinone/menaquinone biosynthesis C-methylase UbiE
MLDDIFWEIHSELPREGPGDNISTRKAFNMMTALPARPEILDVACGPGMQTIELAKVSGGHVTAVDLHQPFLQEVERRVENFKLGERIKTLHASMLDLPFEENLFDVIWCEGAMYMMGVREALTDWKRFLKPNGYIAFTEPCFFVENVPDAVKATWTDAYPAMTTIENTSIVISNAGFRMVGHFTLPETSWWDDYYTPQEKRLETLRQKYSEQPAILARINETQQEIDLHRQYHQFYGYVFFVTQVS